MDENGPVDRHQMEDNDHNGEENSQEGKRRERNGMIGLIPR